MVLVLAPIRPCADYENYRQKCPDQGLCVMSTSASKFEFLELPIGTGSTQFEFKFAGETNLQIYISLTFIVDAHSNLYPRNINVYNTGIYIASNCVLPVPIGSSRNSNFEADVLETHSNWAFLPMIFVISIFKLTKTARGQVRFRF